MMKIIDYIFLLRPIVMIPIWFFFLIGLWHGCRLQHQTLLGQWLPQARELLAFFIYSLVGGGIYVINQIYDRETDRVNRKLFLLADGCIPVFSAWIYWIGLNLTAIILSFFYSLSFLICVVVSVILGILYSVRPFHFKGRPILDMVSNAVGNGFLNTLAGFLVWQTYRNDFAVIMVPYMLATAAVYLVTTIADIPGDRLAGDRTTGVWLGSRYTGMLAVVLMGLSILIGWRQENWLAFFPAVLSFPFFIWAMLSRGVHHFLQAARVCTALMAGGIGLIYPWFILFLLVIVGFSRWYYLKRFGLVYPRILTRDKS